MKKNRLFVFICAALSVGALAGCGGEYGGSSENSGLSVSGQAVSVSAVSGQAVSGQVVSDMQGEEKYLYGNDTNVYYRNYDEGNARVLVERELDTGVEKRIKFGDKEDDGVRLLYVDNDWIYYYMYGGRFCRAPMEKKGNSMGVNLEKEELLFVETAGTTGMTNADQGPFCNGRWIAYVTAEGQFCRYDIRKRESLSPIGESAAMTAQNSSEGVIFWMWQGEESGMYWLDGNSGEFVQVPIGEETYYSNKFCSASGIGVFLPDSVTHNEKDEPEHKIDMRLWHFPDSAHPQGWIEMLAKEDEIRSLLKGREDIDKKALLETVSVFVRNDTVYQQISAKWEKEDVTYRNMIVLSYQLNKDSKSMTSGKTLKVEKELSRILGNPKENQKKFLKIWDRACPASDAFFFSRGVCVEMTEKYAFFLLSTEKKEWRTALYEFESGELRFIDEKSPERGLLLRNCQPSVPRSNYMPDNGKEG